MNKNKGNIGVIFLLIICILILCVVVAMVYFTKSSIEAENMQSIFGIVLYGGIVVLALTFISLFTYMSAFRKGKGDDSEKQQAPSKSKKQKKQVREERIEAREEQAPRREQKVSAKEQKRQEKAQKQQMRETNAEIMPEAKAELDSSATYNGSRVSYSPNMEAACCGL